eukprot:8399-Pelagomonas_calceolata.AAC.1
MQVDFVKSFQRRLVKAGNYWKHRMDEARQSNTVLLGSRRGPQLPSLPILSSPSLDNCGIACVCRCRDPHRQTLGQLLRPPSPPLMGANNGRLRTIACVYVAGALTDGPGGSSSGLLHTPSRVPMMVSSAPLLVCAVAGALTDGPGGSYSGLLKLPPVVPPPPVKNPPTPAERLLHAPLPVVSLDVPDITPGAREF